LAKGQLLVVVVVGGVVVIGWLMMMAGMFLWALFVTWAVVE